ncbi:MAG: DNA replication/repair protein RecF [Nocardioidaceae bacterium]|nr:DNA replication/repair protein RecF [Nocardioidaceae bacterium]
MYVAHLSLTDFRSYAKAEIALSPGVSAFLGPNGQGKTNLVEAVDYVATQSSHRVAADQPLVRFGADQAIVRTAVCRDDRQALVELEINPGRSNRARLNRGAVPRASEVLGILRTVLFSPDDLDLVKGDPSSRRRFLDELLVARQPRFAGVRSDYDRVLRQRNTLLKTAGGRATGRRNEGALATLDVWDAHLARTGAELLAARLELTAALTAPVTRAYADVAGAVSRSDGGNEAQLAYRPSVDLDGRVVDKAELTEVLLTAIADRRDDELDRGVTLVGPHRDDLILTLGQLPTRGYASHGESWSFACALRLAAFELLRSDGDDPVLILDDVFAELDDQRRERLAALVSGTEQVLVTAAVPADVPADLVTHRFDVRDGGVEHA